MQIESEKRLIDANLNRLREGIRVIEDIARYILNDLPLASRLKTLRHRARIDDLAFAKSLLQNRDIKNDILKKSTQSEKTRDSLRDIAMANFKRSEESARVLEEMFKLDFAVDSCLNSQDLECESNKTCDSQGESSEFSAESLIDSRESNDNFCVELTAICEIFKAIRYELYDIEIAYFRTLENLKA